MATPASSSGDDLIILSDDIADTSAPIVTATATLEPKAVITESPIEFNTPAQDIFSGFDLSNLDTPKEVPVVSTVVAEVPPVMQQEVKEAEVVSSVQEISDEAEGASWEQEYTAENTSDEGDMDGILAETVRKLQKRQEITRSTRGSKLSQVDSLNQKIAKLKQQVSQLKDEIAQLESEDAKIEANIVALENMKSVATDVTEADVQPYNQKRVGRSVKKV
jgi:hypothetical protein